MFLTAWHYNTIITMRKYIFSQVHIRTNIGPFLAISTKLGNKCLLRAQTLFFLYPNMILALSLNPSCRNSVDKRRIILQYSIERSIVTNLQEYSIKHHFSSTQI